MDILYTAPSKDASFQVSIHLANSFQRRRFVRNQPIRNNNCLWRPCLFTNWEEMSIIYRRPPIDASYQVSAHLAKRFQRRRFFWNWPIRKKNCLWRPCLSTDWDIMSSLHREPSIDANYQVSVHLAKRFQRRKLKCEKLTDDGRQTTDATWWQKLTLPLTRWAKKGVRIPSRWHVLRDKGQSNKSIYLADGAMTLQFSYTRFICGCVKVQTDKTKVSNA